MANISDLSGDERNQRIAELKKKMQEAAAKRAQERAENPEPVAEEVMETEPDATADTTAEPATEAVAQADDEPASVTKVEASSAEPTSAAVTPTATEAVSSEDSTVVATSESAAGGASAAMTASAPAAVADQSANGTAEPVFVPKPEKTEAEKQRSEMNRREFLVYSWGAAVGLLAVGSGVATFQFMYPRFKAGEFGGAFMMGPNGALPSTEAAPVSVADGKFWWVNIEGEGPKAIYMVCTHLGCLYKWVDERNRFECPCHGSKFTREGYFIEGPAPRSLDHFVTELVDEEWVVDTGARVLGEPAADSPAAIM